MLCAQSYWLESRQDLPGDDQPETVEKVYRNASDWFYEQHD
ncbi:hypothetical protein NBRC111893_99 [Lentilactobacillus kosonis]|uniref:Uncharacterized protein n=1 Tax=Lentilactobacillus kosonis TaxID=2810561 RepID=A0A401FHV7_9LACO|nr:hypothetical protein NBRC111893_99 [Lentilactobacillus kosonis]